MEIANQSCFVFQTDSKIVQDVYRNQPNYLIEYNTQCTNKDIALSIFAAMISIIRIQKRFSRKELLRRIFSNGMVHA